MRGTATNSQEGAQMTGGPWLDRGRDLWVATPMCGMGAHRHDSKRVLPEQDATKVWPRRPGCHTGDGWLRLLCAKERGTQAWTEEVPPERCTAVAGKARPSFGRQTHGLIWCRCSSFFPRKKLTGGLAPPTHNQPAPLPSYGGRRGINPMIVPLVIGQRKSEEGHVGCSPRMSRK